MQKLEFFNSDEAIKNIGGDEEIYLEILKTYADTYGDKFFDENLKEIFDLDGKLVSADPKLCETYGKVFHKIKGASLTVGANKLGEASKDLEKFLRSEDDKTSSTCIEQLKQMLENFKNAYSLTIKELKTLF